MTSGERPATFTMNEKHPDGICPFCNQTFPRPNKYRTIKEELHLSKCEIAYIEQKIKNNKLDYFERFVLADKLDSISHSNSFGAKKGNEQYQNMIKCMQLKKAINI